MAKSSITYIASFCTRKAPLTPSMATAELVLHLLQFLFTANLQIAHDIANIIYRHLCFA